MNSTLGQFFVLLALACAGFGGFLGLWSAASRKPAPLRTLLTCAYGFSLSMVLANLTMVRALVGHDFAVKYVAQVGSLSTPLWVTVVSLWSALEGSILFWGLILGVYLFAFAWANRKREAIGLSWALGTALSVGVFFALLIAGPANPFLAVSPVPTNGPGPNPLLQNHLLMVIHPPMLYLGYVGMVVPFGIAVAALAQGELSETWMRELRRWTLIPWGFLSVGILLGSWWAYAVLGWGGYWAWDPVENASFLPWLTATAFLHSTLVQERRKMLKLWTLSLSLATFVLTLIGTFMTRSGVFNSVHSFTQSNIGPTFLAFIALVLAVSLGLLAFRGPLLVPENQVRSLASREAAIMVNNLLFIALTFTVLLGTTFPLLVEALRGERISVGEPYFNRMAVPGGIAVLFLMGVGPSLPWGSGDRHTLLPRFWLPAAVGIGVVCSCLAAGLRGFRPLLTFGLAGFVVVVTLREMLLPAWVRLRERKEHPLAALGRSVARAPRRFGGYVVHLGVVTAFVAIAASQSFVTHETGTLRPGETMALGNYRLRFVGLTPGEEPHRRWTAADLELIDASGKIEHLSPRMNYYPRSNDPVGSPAVRSGAREDVYVSLLAYSDGGGVSASFNAWVFPLVSWLWASLPFFVVGVLISLWPAGRRAPVAISEPSRETPAGDTAPERGAA